jgi:hypothetical protein
MALKEVRDGSTIQLRLIGMHHNHISTRVRRIFKGWKSLVFDFEPPLKLREEATPCPVGPYWDALFLREMYCPPVYEFRNLNCEALAILCNSLAIRWVVSATATLQRIEEPAVIRGK